MSKEAEICGRVAMQASSLSFLLRPNRQDACATMARAVRRRFFRVFGRDFLSCERSIAVEFQSRSNSMRTLITVGLVVVVVILTTVIVRQRGSIQTLRQENASLRQEVRAALNDTTASSAVSSPADSDEQERLRKEHAELLRLRGEVGSLRRQLNAIAAKRAAVANRSSTPDVLAQSPAVVTNTANLRASLAPGEACVTGGWPGSGQKRVLAFIAPDLGADGSIEITTRLAEVPESVLNSLGLANLKSEPGESATRHILSAEQHSRLMNLLQESDGVDVLSAPRVTTADGRQAQVQVVNLVSVGGQVYPLGPVIDLVPHLSPDRRTIDLIVSAQFLRQTNPPAGN